MDYIIKIDNREKDIIQIFEEKGYNILLENLDLGDFQFIDLTSKEPFIIIERKTYSDLSASIKDGRYKEQKDRLLHSTKKSVRKIMLLEGLDKSKFTLSDKTLEGVIINTIIRDNIHLYMSKSKDETVQFIENIILHLPKYYTELKNEVILGETKIFNNEFSCKSKKKENNTPEICFRNMLSQISGVSNKIADVLVNKYKNMGNFIYELKEHDSKEVIIKLLSEFKYGTSNRRIGEKVAEKIYLNIF
jgi:crossover junction endonuclease MUS81